MQAAILYNVETPQQIQEIDLDAPHHGEVWVRVIAAGICRSDYHVISGDLKAAFPIVLGHEGAGIVERVGEGVTRVKPGDHVALNFRQHCGYCFQCNTGHPYLCDNVGPLRKASRLSQGQTKLYNFLGISCFAEAVCVHESSAVPIAPDIPLDRAALVSCGVLTGIGAVINHAHVEPGASVVVIGAGGVGLNVIQGARLANAGVIIAIDRLDNKLEWAMQFGATHTINSAREDTNERVREIVGKRGADYAFEVIGNVQAIALAFDLIRKGVHAIIVGIPPRDSKVSLDAFAFTDERHLSGTMFGSSRPWLDIPRVLDLYRAGKIKLDELVTRRYPLAQINDAFEALQRGEVARSVIAFG